MGFSYKVDITGKVIMPLQWDSNNADKPRWRTDLEEDAKGPEYIIPLDPRQKQIVLEIIIKIINTRLLNYFIHHLLNSSTAL